MPPLQQLLVSEDSNRFIADSSFLIIDDFSGMRAMLAGVLRNCGSAPKTIDFAVDGREALNQLSSKRYDVVLCDYNLGNGQNGMQVLEEARHKQIISPGCCWIMVTADKTLETVMGTAEAQPDAYLIKPVTEAVLIARIRRIKARKEAFREINQAITQRDPFKAISLCDELSALDRGNALDLLRLKCQLLVDVGQLEKARGHYERVLAAREIPWAQLGLARTYLQAGDCDTACELLEQLVNRSRSYLEAYDCLAETYQLLGLNEKAEHIIERALALSPRSHARQRRMGELTMSNGKLERSERAFRQAIALAEHSVHKSPDSYVGLARVLNQRGNQQEALNIVDQMNKLFDGEESCFKSKCVECRIFIDAGNTTQARKAAGELVAQLDRGDPAKLAPALIREIGETLLAAGESNRALPLLRTEVMNNPEDHGNLEAIRQIFRRCDLTAQGDELVENARTEALELIDASLQLAKSGDFQGSLAQIRQSLDQMPRNVRLLLNLAQMLLAHMELQGPEAPMLRETRRYLLAANSYSPGEPRFPPLMSRLEALSAQ